MYLEEITNDIKTTTKIKIKYDCCQKEHELKYKDANKNFENNYGKHICRSCWLKSDANPAKNKETIKKIKKTNIKKYGSSMPMNSQENIEERRKKFKDEKWKEQWVEKHRQSSLKKYGTDHPMKTKEVQDKQKESMQEKYGVDHPYQSSEILNKMKANNKKKYGVENVASLPEVQIKMAKTTLEKYGVEHYNQLPEMRDYLRENCKEWLKESWKNPWAKGITRPEEWNQKQSKTMAFLVATSQWRGGDKFSLQGWYSSQKCKKHRLMFRSSYELITHIFLDYNDNVEFYDYEPFTLPYRDAEGKLRRYQPDFIIKYKDENKLHLIEVKATYRANATATQSKKEAAELFCEENNMIFEMWLDNKIKELNINYKDDKWQKFIEYTKKIEA